MSYFKLKKKKIKENGYDFVHIKLFYSFENIIFNALNTFSLVKTNCNIIDLMVCAF